MRTTTNQQTIEVIVLKTTPYRENDAIIHVYSLEYGKIGIIARGVRKMTSKSAPGCLSLTKSSMDILLKKGMSTLIRAEAISHYRRIKENIDCEIIANVILEYYYRYLEENTPSLEHYHFLSSSLEALNNGYSPLLIYLLFMVYVLKHEGIELEVDGCVVCHESKVVSISLDGGFVCKEHLGNLPLYDIEVLKAFRHIYKLDIDNIDKIHYDEVHLQQLLPLFDYYIEEYAGIHFKSKAFIQSLF